MRLEDHVCRWRDTCGFSDVQKLGRSQEISAEGGNRSRSTSRRGFVSQTRSSILRERNAHLHRMEQKMKDLDQMDDVLKEKQWHRSGVVKNC